MDDMSKAFTHYYRQLGIGDNLSFKHLRETYITNINNYTNGRAEAVTGHSSQQIIRKHYYDNKSMYENLRDFRLVG